jgi:hypothetical protein
MKSAGKANIEKMTIKNSDLKPLEEKFKEALASLKTQLEVRLLVRCSWKLYFS